MRSQQSGSIILTGSVSGLTAWSHAAPYCATKAAVIQLAKVAAIEYAPRRDPRQLRVPGDVPFGDPRGSPRRGRRRDRGQASARTGNGRRSRGCVLVPRERRVPVDDGIGDRGRRRLLGTVGGSVENASPMRADMSWHAVLEHHAVRTPDKPLAIFGNETVTYGEMATRAAGLAAGLRDRGVRQRRRRRAALVQLHRVPRDDLRGELRSVRSRCRSTGGSPRRSCSTSSNTRKHARSCATNHSSTSRTRRSRAWNASS